MASTAVWAGSPAVNVQAPTFTYEVRFNTLVQSAATGFDELIGLSLTDVADPSRFAATALFSDGNGGNRQFRVDTRGLSGTGFQQPGFAFQNNTWYRLQLKAVEGGNIRAVLLADDGSTELISRDLGITADAFAGGMRVGLYQSNTTGSQVRTDVAIDYARLSTAPAQVTPLPNGPHSRRETVPAPSKPICTASRCSSPAASSWTRATTPRRCAGRSPASAA
ncbi:MAG: hypothetical protein QM742_03885 [Aquabacterium sp.]